MKSCNEIVKNGKKGGLFKKNMYIFNLKQQIMLFYYFCDK